MSDMPAPDDYRDRLAMREQLARIDQAREETLKSVAEQHKLLAEQSKRSAEGRKFNRDPWILIAAAVIAAFAAVVALLPGIDPACARMVPLER
jgi:hypothetical protein